MAKIAIIEDDESIRSLIQIALDSQYQVFAFESAEAYLEAQEPVDVLVLDIMLPGMSGLDLLEHIQTDTSKPAVLLLSAKDREIDKIIGLDKGADDYMTKPFGVMELMARIRNLLRRHQPSSTYVFHGLKVDFEARSVFVDDEHVELTYKEFELLHFLVANRKRVAAREELLQQVWGYDFIGESRTLDVHINSLRKKIKQYGANIRSIRGVGYRFCEEEIA